MSEEVKIVVLFVISFMYSKGVYTMFNEAKHIITKVWTGVLFLFGSVVSVAAIWLLVLKIQ